MWQDELEMMVTQELVAKAMNDVSRQAFEEEKRRIASHKKAAQATSTNQLNTERPFVRTDRSLIKYFSDTLPNDGIFNGAYDDDEDVGAVVDFHNMDNTIAVSPIPTLRIHKDHPKGQILGDPTSAVQTRGKIQKASSAQQALVSYIHKQNRTNHKDHQNCLFACFLSQEEPKTISQALKDERWVEVTQEELLQFKLQQVWILVDLPFGKKAIGTKWVFRNKRDERSIVMKNKARLVAQGHRQEEGIDYDEVFELVARIEATMLFLAFASYMGFLVYQMDVKSAFLYGTIEEEVYVHQPSGFVDPAHPNKVYKVVKALYGLHQSPRAWYETLSSFLLENGFRRGTIDKTLFFKKNKSDIMLVQVYVDNIIFGSTKKSMCTGFEEVMHKRFQMSSMGELTFFLGLQVKQQPDGIFISQDKYVADILKKFNFCSIKTATTPIESNRPLVKDEDGVEVDVHEYRSMIGSLMYLTASRPDIMFDVCACARFQVTPKASHLHAEPVLDRIQPTGGCQFLVEDSYLGSARSRQLWQILLLRQNMLQLLIAVGKDCYEKRLIDVLKIHTDSNVADLLTKGFDVTRISMDLRMDRCSPGKYYSSMVWDIVPLLPAMLAGAAVDQGEGSAQPAEPHHTPVDPISSTSQPPIPSPIPSPPHPSPPPHSPFQSPPHSPFQSPLHSPFQSPHPLPHFSPPRSYEAPLPKVGEELKDTKQTLGNVVLKLVKKVKSLEKALKRKSKKGIHEREVNRFCYSYKNKLWGAQEEDQSTILEAAKLVKVVLGVGKEKSTDKGKRYRRRARSVAKNINIGLDAEEEINTGIKDVNTGSTKVDSGTASKRGQREGKAPMIERYPEVAKQIHLDKMVAKRMAEEEALSEQQKKRKAQVQFEAQFYTEEDWDAIKAKLKANAELTKDVLGKDLPEQDFAKEWQKCESRNRNTLQRKELRQKRNNPGLSPLKKLKFEEIKEEFDKLVQQIDTFVPINLEATKAKLKRYGEELQTKTSKKQRFDDKDVPAIGDKVAEVKEEEPVKRTGKRRSKRLEKIKLLSFGAMVMDSQERVIIELFRCLRRQARIRKVIEVISSRLLETMDYYGSEKGLGVG
ncbi:putative ribonuclease H-like domain-containing protein [Tanacetum coccineum]